MKDNLDDIAPILAVRDKIDSAIQVHLDQVAVLRKRRDALTSAVDVLRCNDYDLDNVAAALPKKKAHVTSFDEGSVEAELIGHLRQNGRRSFSQIQNMLRDKGTEFSITGLRRILKTSPQISVAGVRASTRYFAREASGK